MIAIINIIVVTGQHLSDNSFAIGFLLEIPTRGSPFQIQLNEHYVLRKHNANT